MHSETFKNAQNANDAGQAEESNERRQARPVAQPLLVAAIIFAGALLGTLLLIANRDSGDSVELNASLLTLELAYPESGDPTATLDGEATAAPPGSTVSCRTTSDKRSLGEGEARDDGSVALPLDASPWPIDALGGDAWKTLNDSLECRAGTGSWVQPLRQPRVAIH